MSTPMSKLSSILLVDDDKITNFLNQLLLNDLGVAEQVLAAENGQEALRIIQEQCEGSGCPGLILLDVNMPVMNGFEFLEAYEKMAFTRKQSIIVIMLTTSLHPRDVKRLNGMPIQGFLNKPLTKAMIQELVQKHFSAEPSI
jgi:CheY-like chemotaxis protein